MDSDMGCQAGWTFRLFVNLAALLVLGSPLLMLVIGLVSFPAILADAPADEPAAWFLVFWLGAMGFGVVLSGRIPTRIELAEEGRIRFRGLLRRIEVQATEIESIKPRAQLGLLSVKHSGGRILLINQFDGFHEFLVELKRLNPSVELRGC